MSTEAVAGFGVVPLDSAHTQAAMGTENSAWFLSHVGLFDYSIVHSQSVGGVEGQSLCAIGSSGSVQTVYAAKSSLSSSLRVLLAPDGMRCSRGMPNDRLSGPVSFT